MHTRIAGGTEFCFLNAVFKVSKQNHSTATKWLSEEHTRKAEGYLTSQFDSNLS